MRCIFIFTLLCITFLQARADEERSVPIHNEFALRLALDLKVKLTKEGVDFLVYSIALDGVAVVMVYFGDHPDLDDVDQKLTRKINVNGMAGNMWEERRGPNVRVNVVINLLKNKEEYKYAHFYYELPVEYSERARAVWSSLVVKDWK